jgi:serine protease Do
VYMRNVNERQAKQMGMSAVRGVFIDSVFIGSPADQAGLRRGDVVVKFNNQDVANGSQFSVLVTTVRHGVSIPMEVIRDGDHLTLNTVVGDRNTSLAQAPQREDGEVPTEVVLGMELSAYTPKIAAEIGGEHVPGLYVWSVYPGTAADVAGITAGSVIMKVGKTSVTTIEELVKAVREEADGSRISLIVQEPDGAIARKMLRR